MEPAHYAGLLRVGLSVPQAAPPRCDPNFSRLGEVMVRDLSLYEAGAASERRCTTPTFSTIC